MGQSARASEEVEMDEHKHERKDDPKHARERSKTDDPTRQTRGQVDDNQDDRGRDVNDPRRIANKINEKGH
jgi:hypothetical protein